jgi:hypothetical protein
MLANYYQCFMHSYIVACTHYDNRFVLGVVVWLSLPLPCTLIVYTHRKAIQTQTQTKLTTYCLEQHKTQVAIEQTSFGVCEQM